MALAASEGDTSRSLSNFANAYSSQADVLKQRNQLKNSKKIEREMRTKER